MPAKKLIKIAISGLLLVLIYRYLDYHKLKNVFQTLHPFQLVLVIAIYALGQILSSIKWWMIARAGGIPVSYLRALRAYFVGMFINCFGLGLVGGDVARGFLLAQGQTNKASCFASVVADRIHGLAVLASIGVVSLLIAGPGRAPQWLPLLLTVVLLTGITCWFILPFTLRKLFSPQHLIRQKLDPILAVFPKKPAELLKITLLSLVFHFSQISLHMVMASTIGLTLAWGAIFSSVPFINILCSLPLSWNGLGVRENAYNFFLHDFVSQEQAVALGATWLTALGVSSAIGGTIAFLSGDLQLVKAHTNSRKQPQSTGELPSQVDNH